MPKLIQVGEDTVEFPDSMGDAEIEKILSQAQQASQKIAQAQQKTEQSLSQLNPKLTPGEVYPQGPTPSGSELGVNALRTGVPIAAAFATKNPASLALITGLSELAADELEERYENPNYQGEMDFLTRKAQHLKDAGTSAGLSYLGDRFLAPWVGKQVSKLQNFTTRPLMKQTLGRALVPGELPQQPGTAQRFLGRLRPTEEGPFSLTLDQLHTGQRTIMEQLGSISRSSFGGGKRMRKMDMRNEEAVTQFVTNFLRASSETTPRQFGNTLKALLNKETAYLKTQTNTLFDEFREMAYDKGIRVQIGDALDYLKENSTNRFARGVLAKVVKSDPVVLSKVKGAEQLMMLPADQLENVFQSMPPGKVEEFLNAMDVDVPVETAVDLYHNINRMFGRTKEAGMKRFSTQFRQRLDDAMSTSLKPEQGAYNKFKEANAFAAKHGARTEQKIMEQLFKRVGEEKPASVLTMFSGARGGDTIASVKRFFETSDVLSMEDFDRSIRQPLRHWMLSLAVDKDTGIVSGSNLARVLDMAEKRNGPEFLKEIFGSHTPTALREAASTLSLLQSTKESNIVIKIMQATALGGLTAAAMYGSGQPIERVAMGTFGVLLAPLALARVLSNPKLVRTLTDGMIKGAGSTQFQRAVMVAMVQNRKAFKDLAKLSPEAQQFYMNSWEGGEQPSESPEPMGPQTLGDIPGTAGMFFPETPLMQ